MNRIEDMLCSLSMKNNGTFNTISTWNNQGESESFVNGKILAEIITGHVQYFTKRKPGQVTINK